MNEICACKQDGGEKNGRKADGQAIGNGRVRKDEVCRLFILPQYQNMGYGTWLMDFLEGKILRQSDAIHVVASFPAEAMYLGRGYRICYYEKIQSSGGGYLCCHTMEKRIGYSMRKTAGKIQHPIDFKCSQCSPNSQDMQCFCQECRRKIYML